MNSLSPVFSRDKDSKPRCTARILQSKQIWGKHVPPYFGTQCVRGSFECGSFCKMHVKHRKGGTFGEHIDLPVHDIKDETYTILKKTNPLLNHEEYKKCNLTINDYVIYILKQHKNILCQKVNENNLENVIHEVYKTGGTTSRKEQIEFAKQICSKIHIESVNESVNESSENDTKNKNMTQEFVNMQQWWKDKEKIKIIDYNTKAVSIFAIVDRKIYTQNQVCVGEEKYWKDPNITNDLKNSDGYILDPETQSYLSQILLYEQGKSFHNLTKNAYTDFKYIPEYNILQKTNEIEYIYK